MKSALVLVLAGSCLALSVACDNAADNPGTINVAGNTGTGNTGNTGTGNTGNVGTGNTGNVGSGGTGTQTGGGTDTGSGGTGSATEGVPLIPTDGWVDGAGNALGIQGAIFAYGDDTSKMGMMEEFKGANACISGTAAKVDTSCTPVPPATDCYGTFWGAAIGLNLNQPIDETSGKGADPLPFDATHLTGFSFTLTGSATGEAIPTTMRFKVEDSQTEYCTWKTVGKGPNTVLFNELETKCWEHAKGTGVSATTAQSGIIKIAWQVVTNTGGPIPFDYCVTDIRAITDGTTPVGTGGSGTGGSGTGGSGTAGTTATGGGGSGTGGETGGTGGTGGAAGGSGGSGGS